MSTTAEIPVEQGVAHVALNAGPSARLTVPVLQQIDDALRWAEAEDAVEIVVLSGKGAGFPSGLTEPDAGGDDRDNRLSDLCRRIERFGKPVIAVLTGAVVGGGAELALACHYRLVHKEARIGFPNARLGLVPRAGATQRLPRLVGAEASLDLLLGGHLLPLSTPRLAPLADQVFDDGRYEAIVAFVAALRAEGARPRPTAEIRTGFADGPAFQAAVNDARHKLDPKHDVAAAKILASIEAALVLPFDAGLAFEEAAAEDCAETPEAKALSHVFHAEQTAGAQTRRADLGAIRSIAVLGPGSVASQIVVAALDAGVGVNWVIRDPEQRRDATAHVQALLQEGVLKGRIGADRAAQCLAALKSGDSPQMLDGVDMALRAARGQRGVHVPPNVPLAHCLTGSDPRLAMRFAPVTPGTRLVEVILGPDGTDADLRSALGLARKLNTLAIVERSSGPSLQDRLTGALWRAADALVDLGQSPFALDTALRDWGMALPPYALADHVGLELVGRQDRSDGARNWSSVLAGLGRSGGLGSPGFYLHPKNGKPTADPKLLSHINDMRPPKPDMPALTIRRLLFGAMANEGAKALRESMVHQASDIDLVSILTGLLPRWSGGVMHHACVKGLLQITRAMADLPHPDRAFWTPDPVFAELIKNGRTFDDR